MGFPYLVYSFFLFFYRLLRCSAQRVVVLQEGMSLGAHAETRLKKTSGFQNSRWDVLVSGSGVAEIGDGL